MKRAFFPFLTGSGVGPLIVLLIFGTITASAASYDGQWVADVPVQGKCPAAHLTLFVSNGAIVGNAFNPAGTFPITGRIDHAGDGTIRIGSFTGRIKFFTDRFAADYFNNCGERRAIGRRLVTGEAT